MDEFTILHRAVGSLRGFAIVLRNTHWRESFIWRHSSGPRELSARLFQLAVRLTDNLRDAGGRDEEDRMVRQMVADADREGPSIEMLLRAQIQTYDAIARALSIHHSPGTDRILAEAARTLADWSSPYRGDHPPMAAPDPGATATEPESFEPERSESRPATAPMPKRPARTAAASSSSASSSAARARPARSRKAAPSPRRESRGSRLPPPADALPSPPRGRDSPSPYRARPAAAAVADEPLAGEIRESGAKPKIADTEYVVWYGTNRRPVDAADPSRGYSSARDKQVHYGSCRVFIPESHKIGSIGSGWWRRLVSRKDDRLKLLSVDQLWAPQFWEQLSARVRKSRKRTGVVFIHGYNVSFEEAALRAAQLGFDLNLKGAMAFFSWPSKGTLAGYGRDGQTIDASKDAIASFLVDFAERSGAERIHVIAHSMGNRGVLGAVNKIGRIVEGRTGVRFGQFILAAADVDADVFRNDCEPYRQLGERTTLYISAKDLAVEAASWLYDYPRVGFLPPVMVLPGIDTVAVTNIDLTLLGHGYVAEARDVLRDIHSLIDRDRPPDHRFGLRETSTAAGDRYWEIRA